MYNNGKIIQATAFKNFFQLFLASLFFITLHLPAMAACENEFENLERASADHITAVTEQRAACGDIRLCKKTCRTTKRDCKRIAKSDKNACKNGCRSLRGKDKKNCKRNCRLAFKSAKDACRLTNSACKGDCRTTNLTPACQEARDNAAKAAVAATAATIAYSQCMSEQ